MMALVERIIPGGFAAEMLEEYIRDTRNEWGVRVGTKVK